MNTSAPVSQITAETCPICLADRLTNWLVDPRFVTCRCVNCGYLLTTIRPGHEVREDYFASVDNEEAYEKSVGAIRAEQMKAILDRLARTGIIKGELLDIGPGYGWLLREAGGRGFRVFGVEPSNAHAKALAAGFNVLHGAFPDVCFEQKFNIVTEIDVIEHVPLEQLPKFLTAVRSSLLENGIFVVKVPDSAGLIFQAAALCHKLSGGRIRAPLNRMLQLEFEYPHVSYFNRQNLSHYLERLGFSVVDVMHHPEISLKTTWNRVTYQYRSSRFLRFGYFVALLFGWILVRLTG